MTKDLKKFIVALGLSNEMTAFLLENKLSFTVANIVIEKNKTVTFDAITDFWKVEKTTLTQDEQPIWDLFHDFNSNKNGVNVLMSAIETGNPVDDSSFENQSKLTPKDGALKTMTFVQFWATLDQEQKTKAVAIGQQWLLENHIFMTSFEFFAINNQHRTYKDGDYLLGYDETYGIRLATKVLQASPNGFVTCVDGEGVFTLGHTFRPEEVVKETLNAKVVAIIDPMYDGLNEESAIMKSVAITKAMNIMERREKASAKAFDSIHDAKITTVGLLERYTNLYNKNTFTKEESEILEEKLAIAKKTIEEGVAEVVKVTNEKKAEFDRLMALKLTSKDAIAKAVGDANKAKFNKELQAQFKERVREATDKLKADAEPVVEVVEVAPSEPKATDKGTRKPNPIEPKAKAKA